LKLDKTILYVFFHADTEETFDVCGLELCEQPFRVLLPELKIVILLYQRGMSSIEKDTYYKYGKSALPVLWERTFMFHF
jgi:hypothetical protein